MKRIKNTRINAWFGGMDEDHEWILVDESYFNKDEEDEEHDHLIPSHHTFKGLLGEYKILC